MEIKYYPLHVVCNYSGIVTWNSIPMLLFGRPTVAQGVNKSVELSLAIQFVY